MSELSFASGEMPTDISAVATSNRERGREADRQRQSRRDRKIEKETDRQTERERQTERKRRMAVRETTTFVPNRSVSCRAGGSPC